MDDDPRHWKSFGLGIAVGMAISGLALLVVAIVILCWS